MNPTIPSLAAIFTCLLPSGIVAATVVGTSLSIQSVSTTTQQSALPAVQRPPDPELDLSNFRACPVDVEADGAFTCIRRSDGTAQCFGYNAPTPSGRFMNIDAGREAFCGVRTDGKLACWATPAPLPPRSPIHRIWRTRTGRSARSRSRSTTRAPWTTRDGSAAGAGIARDR